MKAFKSLQRCILIIGLLWLAPGWLYGQGMAFTYQGRLNSGGNPANGSYDLTFSLYNVSSGGSAVAGPLTTSATGVTNGLFTVTLDFGSNVFTGVTDWLDIGVRTHGNGAFTGLSPRQQLTPTPYAIYSEAAGAANSVAVNSVSVPQLNTVGPPASGQVLAFGGSGLVWTNPAGGSAGWSLTGNAGTSQGTDFLGTTDNSPLELAVNNTKALTLYPGANNAVNLTVGPFAFFSIGAQGVNVFGGTAGAFNVVYPNYSTIGGGYNNTINSFSPESVIGGGQGNVISGSTSVIGGGYFNTNSGQGGTIPGGFDNFVGGSYSFAAGNTAQAINNGAFVWADNSGGAFASSADNQFSVRALGGVRFVTGGAGVTVDGQPIGSGGGGGSGWSLTGNSGTIPGTDFLGTTDNEPLELWVNSGRALRLEPNASGLPNVIGGAPNNTVTAGIVGSTIGGGSGNTASGRFSTVAGGTGNLASGPGTFVGGGGYDGTTSPGGNTAYYTASTVVGGVGNSAQAYYAAVVGGYSNTASGSGAFVGGGYDNTASQFVDTVAGGLGNTASGGYSFAAGDGAQAINAGAFVWADSSSGTHFTSTANNQFSVRANGGVRFVTGGAGVTIDGVPVVPGGGGGGGSASNAWLLTGNAGANPAAGYFLGTTDTNGLELHVNGERGMRLDYALESFGFLNNESSINVNNGYWGNSIASGIIGATIAGGGSAAQEGFQFFSNPNSVSGDFGTIGGGYNNYAGDYTTVGGGYNNTAGNYSTIPGGHDNYAVGNGSFALGRSASVSYDGSFVWSDGTATLSASGPNQFDALATGGVSIRTSGGTGMTITSGGKVGINENTPSQQLEVNGEFMLVDGYGNEQAYLGGDGSGGDVQIGSLNPLISAVACYNAANGSYMHLYCSSITIEGGADLAEPFQISTPQKEDMQGEVVVIDDEHPGRLKVSDRPYDTRVAGVVSGANGIHPGIQMQQQGLLEGGKNVALTGRVYVQADAANGAIKPGDLLTTSDIPGRAMKVSDHARAQGAILGKAMSGLKEGQGMVLVLVTLQ